MSLSIRSKLFAAFGAVLALLCVCVGVALLALSGTHSKAAEIADRDVPAMEVLGRLSQQVEFFRASQIAHTISITEEEKTTRETQQKETDASIDELFGRYADGLVAGAPDRERMQSLRDAWEAYQADTSQLVRIDRSGRRDLGAALLNDHKEQMAEVRDGIVEWIDERSDAAGANIAAADATSDKARAAMIAIGAVALLIGAALAFLISRSIARRSRSMLLAAQGIAEGDLDQDVDVSGTDELARTGAAFAGMVEYLRGTAEHAKAIAAGDLDVAVEPKSERDVLGVAFRDMAAGLRAALGDKSSLYEVRGRLRSLSDHCLTDLETALGRMSAGDLTVSVEPQTRPIEARDGRAPGELAELFNEMLAKVQASIEAYNATRAKVAGMVHAISESSSTVASASQQMASTSEEAGRAVSEIASAVSDAAQGAERQVQSVETVRVATEQMAAATAESALTAEQTAEAGRRAKQIAAEGAGAVEQATAAMRAVRDASVQTTEAIRRLGERSERIGGIVETITGIAEQTNLLALNAAIEAARAGEQGRGFAVVAEEVRKLAEESQQAASSIAELVQEMQDETGRTVAVVEEGAGATEQGVGTVEQARESFLEIGTSVDDMNGRLERISLAFREIAEASERVQHDVADVASVAEETSASSEEVSASTEQTSASTQEIAASAQELAGTAGELERLVAQFRIARG